MPPTDSDRPDGDGRSAQPADPSVSLTGTVAEEAAKLVEMLAAAGGPWASTASTASTAGASRTAGPGVHFGSQRRDSNGSNGPAGSKGSSSSNGAEEPHLGTSSDRPGASRSGTHTCTCGGTTPQACRLCPVCQVISFVSAISPETIDRAADLVGFAATALRDLATAQRERQQAAERPAPTGEDVP